MLPGECRHGRYPTADGKRPRAEQPSSSPINDWKKAARSTPMEDVTLEFPKHMPLSSTARVYWKAALLQVIQDSLAVFSEATDIGKDYHHWITDQTLLAILRECVEKFMYLKGVKVCLRPSTKASPEPQLSTHTAPLRIQVHGTVKHWIMDEPQDLTTCSKRQIAEAVDINAWQITLFGKELGDGGKRQDSVAKSAPRTPVPASGTPAPSTPFPVRAPSTPIPATSSTSTPFPVRAPTTPAIQDELPDIEPEPSLPQQEQDQPHHELVPVTAS